MASMARDKAYLEAEKKIEQALKSDTTEIDLTYRDHQILQGNKPL